MNPRTYLPFFLGPRALVRTIASVLAAVATLVATTHSSPAAEAPTPPPTGLVPELAPLRPFLQKTWRGEFKNSTPEKPVIDISRWERALNGQAIRVLHSINRGEYGGETLIYWDREKKTIAYAYFTTAGFRTTGTMTLTQGRYESREVVQGDATGVTEVRASGELRPDGSLVTKSEYLKNGNWVPGHEAVYREAPTETVVFR